MRPLEYWANERVVYEASSSGDLTIVGVLAKDEARAAPPRRRAASPPRKVPRNDQLPARRAAAAAAPLEASALRQQTLRKLGGKLVALGLGTTIGRSLSVLLPLARLAQEAAATLGALSSDDLTVRRAAWAAASLACSGGKCAAVSGLVHVVSLHSSIAMSCALSGALLLGASFAPPALDELVHAVVEPLLPLLGTMKPHARRHAQRRAAHAAAAGGRDRRAACSRRARGGRRWRARSASDIRA
jgi:hypothetical protein